MRTDTLSAPDAGTAPDPRGLDALAHRVAERLEAGEVELAWSMTRALEARVAGSPPPDEREEERPPAPVIGRRFAAAHGALLRGGARRAAVRVAA
jgi:hypothetical protein